MASAWAQQQAAASASSEDELEDDSSSDSDSSSDADSDSSSDSDAQVPPQPPPAADLSYVADLLAAPAGPGPSSLALQQQQQQRYLRSHSMAGRRMQAALVGHLPAGANSSSTSGRQRTGGGSPANQQLRQPGLGLPARHSTVPQKRDQAGNAVAGPGTSSSSRRQQGPASSSHARRSSEQQQSLPDCQPSARSTRAALHCDVCDCFVPAGLGNAAWADHCRGIRHRRQALSLKHTGERGNMLVSQFEAVPGHEDPQYRLVGRSSGAFKLGQHAQQQAQHADISKWKAVSQGVLKELLNLCGGSPAYRQLAPDFSPERLVAAHPEFRKPTVDHYLWIMNGDGFVDSPAHLVVKVQAARDWAMQKGQLLLLVVKELIPNSSRAASVGAALCFGLNRLAEHDVVLSMELQLSVEQPSHAHVPVLVHRLALCLRNFLERSSCCQWLELHLPRHLRQEDFKGLEAAASRELLLSKRQAVMLAMHPRLRGKHPLQWLPNVLLKQILDAAVPLHARRLKVRWV